MVCPTATLGEAQDTLTELIEPAGVTAIVVEPDFVVSCWEVAVIVAVPVAAAVKVPLLFMLPMLAGLTDHVTALLKLPVPVTVGVQVDV